MAAEKGNLKAMNNYACMVKVGDGFPVNLEEAVKYFKMAVDKGYQDSIFIYAAMLYKGSIQILQNGCI